MKLPSRLHIILFTLTVASTIIVGAVHEGVDLIDRPFDIYRGIPFSISLLLILLAHEFSHYFASRRHGVDATLPYFLPAPTLFGTFGAFIKMKSPITTRNALVDIGASGPIAGFLVSCIIVIIGLNLPASHSDDDIIYGTSLLFYWLAKMILGPSVSEGFSVHSIALAGWIGFFVTSINLIPIGQLDGGHIAYAILGERHEKISKILVGVLLVLGMLLFTGWLIWAVLLFILGFKHPPIRYPEVPLDRRRKAIGIISLLIFILTFMPVPVSIK